MVRVQLSMNSCFLNRKIEPYDHGRIEKTPVTTDVSAGVLSCIPYLFPKMETPLKLGMNVDGACSS